MDGRDLERRIVPVAAGRATRSSLMALGRRQGYRSGTTAAECRKLGRAEAYEAEEGTMALGRKVEAARRS